MDQFIKKTRVANIVPVREISHFITLIKKTITDHNINISNCGFYIAQNLAKGLKKNFTHIAKNILNEVFAKFKDLKPNTVLLATNTLKAMLVSLNIEDLVGNLKEGMVDKSPIMREEILKLVRVRNLLSTHSI